MMQRFAHDSCEQIPAVSHRSAPCCQSSSLIWRPNALNLTSLLLLGVWLCVRTNVHRTLCGVCAYFCQYWWYHSALFKCAFVSICWCWIVCVCESVCVCVPIKADEFYISRWLWLEEKQRCLKAGRFLFVSFDSVRCLLLQLQHELL